MLLYIDIWRRAVGCRLLKRNFCSKQMHHVTVHVPAHDRHMKTHESVKSNFVKSYCSPSDDKQRGKGKAKKGPE